VPERAGLLEPLTVGPMTKPRGFLKRESGRMGIRTNISML